VRNHHQPRIQCHASIPPTDFVRNPHLPIAAAEPAGSLTVGEGFTNPIGFHDATPTFSWKLPKGVAKQSAYRLEVQDKDLLWDSGWVDSDQSVFVPYGGKPLASRQQLTWRVDYRDDKGEAAGWSKPASFELGLAFRQGLVREMDPPGGGPSGA
jgi:hypothetical protein